MRKSAHKLSIRFCSTILTFVVASFFFAPSSHAACSPGIPCTGYDVNVDATLNDAKKDAHGARCDGNLMNQMYSRAYLEAERDYLLGMSIIRKPDSVLEYTCFEQFIGIAGDRAAPIFSETTDWVNRSIVRNTGDQPNSNPITINVVRPAGELTTMLEDMLLEPLEEFIDRTSVDGSFSHTFLGGLTALDHNMTFTAPAPTSYNCAHMQQVWHIAKCIDFGEEDQFWSFEELTNIDPRVLPDTPNPPFEECSPGYTPSGPVPSAAGGFGVEETDPCPTPAATSDPNHDYITNDIIRTSNNCDFLYVIFDTLDMYYELIRAPGSYPGSAVPTINCAGIDPIPTGVTVNTYTYTRTATGPQGLLVIDKTGATHQDKFCPNPSCSYDAAGDVCY